MRYEKNVLEQVVKESNSYSNVVRKVGLNVRNYGNRQTIKRYIEKYDLSITHFGNYAYNRKVTKIELSEILVEKSTYTNTAKLKEKLYKAGLKIRQCELCPQGEEWMGKRMSLILDHINGNNKDNRIENLRIVCPNCNATLDTHCKGNSR
jgi:hypothetical protein